MRNPKHKADSDLQYKAALETIVSASAWPSARVHEAYDHVSPFCTRCNTETIDTALHFFWTCPCTADIDHENVSDSQALITQAVTGADEYPCMWLRGISLSSFTIIDPINDPTEDINSVYLNPENLEWTHNTYYGDASGGKHTSYPTLRRVGVAVVQVNPDGELTFGAHFNLPGKIQTVGRGELYALHSLVNRLELCTIALFVTDNKNVFDTYIKGRMAAMSSNNCVTYGLIFLTSSTINIYKLL